MNLNDTVTDMADVSDKTLQLNVGALALSVFAQLRPDVLKQSVILIEVFSRLMEIVNAGGSTLY